MADDEKTNVIPFAEHAITPADLVAPADSDEGDHARPARLRRGLWLRKRSRPAGELRGMDRAQATAEMKEAANGGGPLLLGSGVAANSARLTPCRTSLLACYQG